MNVTFSVYICTSYNIQSSIYNKYQRDVFSQKYIIYRLLERNIPWTENMIKCGSHRQDETEKR